MRLLFSIVGALIVLGVLVLAGGLGLAHLAIRQIAPPLPPVAEIASAFEAEQDLPVRLSFIETASQAMPRSAVLERSLDPEPDEPYVMTMPSFVLEWADGRIFLIDAGLDREAALAFGAPNEAVVGAEPMLPKVDVASALGDSVGRVAGLAFTHLHTDHTNGALALCAARGSGSQAGATTPLFQTTLQATESNYTTRRALDELEGAPCLEPRVLEVGPSGSPLLGVPGFPGLAMIAAGGHTPGSQIFVARVTGQDGTRTWVFTGDLVNHVEGVRQNLPKPRLYSLLVVPEDPERLDLLRRYLRDVSGLPGVELLVSHDQAHLRASGIDAF